MAFENLLSLITNDDDRNSLEAVAKKFPRVKEYMELGETYEPAAAKLSSIGFKDPVEAADRLISWNKFGSESWPDWKAQHEALELAKAAAESRVQELEARGDTDMDAADIKKIVAEALAEAGVVDNKALEAKLNDLVEKRVTPSLNGMANRFQQVYAGLTNKAIEHDRTFGKPIDYTKIFEYMDQSGERDPQKAYSAVYSSDFDSKRDSDYQKKLDEESKKAREEGIAEGRKLAAASAGAAGSIVDGGGGSTAGSGRLGPLQRARLDRARNTDGKVDTDKIPLGKGIGEMAAQTWREKQMSGSAN